ncbi:unnamed protein product [Cyberlindnera jadinii]|uniref:Sodium/calcium exchanger membrane region domain-containing protein n=1 Tax=Cyberlindnera jadinii (strain ATCC 18201 / CBS 1600 / BCRC 20928 / JCM 3617 / NBRC 0987 / NRRL Y-1542) TaxID=983966 RepID=A0A0H5C8G5_CYBJN|nr:unnamed protein product [Cyberlindnera jadinii]
MRILRHLLIASLVVLCAIGSKTGLPRDEECDISGLREKNDSAICLYIKHQCATEMFHWSEWYFCGHSSKHKLVVISLLILIIVLIFVAFSVITSNFVYPNLNLLSNYLGISERISGLTLLALGNATPDIFSTYTAFTSNSSGLAFGELMGSANFVICFVIGAMGLLRPFKVHHHEFMKDLYSFLSFIILALVLIADAKLWNGECALMVVAYIAYVIYTIVFTNEGKEYEVEGDEEHHVLVPNSDTLSPPLDTIIAESIKSGDLDLDVDRIRNSQKLSVFQAQRVWRALSPANSPSRTGSPSISRSVSEQFQSSKRFYTFPEMAMSDDATNYYPKIVSPTPLPAPQITVTEASEDSHGSEEPHGLNEAHEHEGLHVLNEANEAEESRELNEGHETDLSYEPLAERVDETNDDHSTISSVMIEISGDYPWRFLLEPFVDEPITTFNIISAPIVILFNVMIPTYPEKCTDSPRLYESELNLRKRLMYFQLFTSPFLLSFLLFPHLTLTPRLLNSMALVLINVPLNHYASVTLPLTGFVLSIVTIMSLSSVLIPILKNIGVIFQISESLLGLTILALGNSVGDLISNLTLARLNLSVIGVNACFGSPLLYILLGIGVNGLVVNVRKGAPYMPIQVDSHFKVSSIGLVTMLCFYAIYIPLNRWWIDRRVGVIGITWWCLITAVNVYFEIKR